jgi:hypothetical protein
MNCTPIAWQVKWILCDNILKASSFIGCVGHHGWIKNPDKKASNSIDQSCDYNGWKSNHFITSVICLCMQWNDYCFILECTWMCSWQHSSRLGKNIFEAWKSVWWNRFDICNWFSSMQCKHSIIEQIFTTLSHSKQQLADTDTHRKNNGQGGESRIHERVNW